MKHEKNSNSGRGVHLELNLLRGEFLIAIILFPFLSVAPTAKGRDMSTAHTKMAAVATASDV